MWVIPPEHSGELVAPMEDVLEVYQRPSDPQAPLIGMDEQPVQLLKETRQPLAAVEGHPERYDYAYERNGTANLCLFTEPLRGQRFVRVRERKTAMDWATKVQYLLEVHYPEAGRLRLVCEQLNTHGMGSL